MTKGDKKQMLDKVSWNCIAQLFRHNSGLEGGLNPSAEGGAGVLGSHSSWQQQREVSAATSLLAGPSRSPLSGGLRMEVLIKASHRSALSSSSPSPASLRIHPTKRMLGQSRCHLAGDYWHTHTSGGRFIHLLLIQMDFLCKIVLLILVLLFQSYLKKTS